MKLDPNLKAKGNKGEDDLKAWLDLHGFSYVKIDQDGASFAKLFPSQVKRPDFLVLIDSIGMIAVDVKNRKRFANGFTLPYAKEYKLSLAFERIFRVAVWYAYCGPDPDTWFWISALKAVEVGIPCNRKGETFLKIGLSDFVCVRSGADFGKLYTQRMPGYTRVGEDELRR